MNEPTYTGDQDGFGVQNMDGLAKEFLAPGADFKEKIARGGLSMEDAQDWGEIWRAGITFRCAIMVEHADHAVTSSIGQDRLARTEAISAVSGGRQHQMEMQARKRGLMPFGRRGGQAEENPQVSDGRAAG